MRKRSGIIISFAILLFFIFPLHLLAEENGRQKIKVAVGIYVCSQMEVETIMRLARYQI